MTKPAAGTTGFYHTLLPNGQLGPCVGGFEVTRVEGNLAWAIYDHLPGMSPAPFIWRFKDRYNRCHIWPGHPDYEPSDVEMGSHIPEEYAEP